MAWELEGVQTSK